MKFEQKKWTKNLGRFQGDLNQGPTGLRSGVLTITPWRIAAENGKILSLLIAESLMSAVHVDRHFMSNSDTDIFSLENAKLQCNGHITIAKFSL